MINYTIPFRTPIICFLLFVISTNCRAQLFDRLDIYAIHLSTSFAGDNIDANYVRVNASYKFISRDKSYIEEVYTYFFRDKHKYLEFDEIEVSTGIRLVIDFVKGEQVRSFVLLNSGHEFFVIKSSSEQSKFYLDHRSNEDEIKKVVPFYKLIKY